MQRWPTMSVLLLAALTALAGCQTNAATGRRDLNFVGTQQEISIGLQAAPQFLDQYGGPIKSPAVVDYVSNLGKRLAAASERPDLPWEFHAVDSSVLNAFALPGGKVFVTRELLSKLGSEAQLAGVLGHEIGHVTASHIGQQMTRATILQGIVAGLGMAADKTDKDYLKVLGVGAQTGGSVYLLSFGRDQESQADELGLRYMTRLGYNPEAQIEVMQVLQKAGGSGAQPEWLSTHPYPDTRVERLNKLLKEKYANYNVQPPVYRMGQAEYKAAVLDKLARLPAPANDPEHKYSSAGKALR